MAKPTKQLLYNDVDEVAFTHANFHWTDRDSNLCVDLPAAAGLVFSRIVLCASRDKETGEWIAKLDYGRMARITGLSVGHCKKMVKLLEEEKLIMVDRRTGDDGSEVNIYTLPAPEMWRVGKANTETEREIIKARKKDKLEKRAAFHKMKAETLAVRDASFKPKPHTEASTEDGPDPLDGTDYKDTADYGADKAAADTLGMSTPPVVAKGSGAIAVAPVMRHADPRIALELYAQGEEKEKRAAQEHVSGLFLVEKIAS